jgi:hypothetical protein
MFFAITLTPLPEHQHHSPRKTHLLLLYTLDTAQSKALPLTNMSRHSEDWKEELAAAFVPENAYGVRVKKWTNKINNMGEEKTDDYDTIHLYIIDDVAPGTGLEGSGSAVQVEHAHKCNLVRHFGEHGVKNCIVHSVRMPPGTDAAAFTRYFSENLRQHSRFDLGIYYFHGTSGGEDENTTW